MCASVSSKKREELNFKLVEAAFRGSHLEVSALLEEGADADAKERHGNTALAEAALAGHTPTVGVLLRFFADPNLPGEDGRTALHRAAFHGWNPAVELLLNHGADPDAKDESGKSPSQIARAWKTREILDNFSREKHQEIRKEKDAERAVARPAQEERKSPSSGDTAEKPTKIMIVEEDDETEEPAAESKFKFAPKSRAGADAKKAKAAEAEQRKAVAAQELAEMIEEAGPETLPKSQIETAEGEIEEKDAAPIIEVCGAGESRINGQYYLRSAYTDRIEFGKVGDDRVIMQWSNWANEWRINIGDYKKGNTLYRHSHRPSKAEPCHGVPFSGWVKWFGTMPAPTIRSLSPGDDEEPTKLQISEEEPAESAEEEGAGASKAKAKTNQFLELSSNLRIVECDDGAARRAAAAASVAGRSTDISLSSGKLVETADGLFGAEEVAADEHSEATKAAQAAAWLKETSGKIKMAPIWPAVIEAKEHAAVRFRDGDLATARDLTTAALSAIEIIVRKYEMGDACLRDAPQEASEEAKGSLAPEVVPEDEIDNMKGILHSNRALLLLRQVDDEDAEVLEYGRDAAFRLILNDADEALRRDAQNYKASYRRALALFELGELEEALDNATKVVEHYSNTSTEPNPEAVALREKVQTAIKEERKMWGQRAPRNWNRGVECVPVAEVSEPQTQTSKSVRRVEAPTMPWEKPVSREPRQIPVVQRELAPPKNSADVEKALMSTLKNDEAKQVEYVEKHLSRQSAKKIFKRTPVGPDLLAVLIKILGKVLENSKEKAAEILSALGALPSASTYAAMLDTSELQLLRGLVSKLGPEAAEPWQEALDPKKESDDMD